MERVDAINRLEPLIGSDLRPLADEHQVTVWKNGKLNKGWVGHTVERILGLPINSSRSPNFGSWELKVVSLKYLKSGTLVPKETMAVTMLDPIEVAAKKFKDSHLYTKLRKLLVVSRIYESREEERTLLHGVSAFDFANVGLYDQIKADYDSIRSTINTKGVGSLTGKMGVYIQPRTKGPGHGSVSRAFYCRTSLVSRIVGL